MSVETRVKAGSEQVEQVYHVGEVPISYWEYGEPSDKPPLVVVNGISTRKLGTFPGHTGRHVLAIDRPYYTSLPKHPSLKDYTEYMGQAADGIIEQRYGELVLRDVLGISWGGMAAQRMAVDEPERIRRLVIAAAVPATPMLIGNIPRLRSMFALGSTSRTAQDVESVLGGDVDDDGQKRIDEIVPLFQGREVDSQDHQAQLLAGLQIGELIRKRMWQQNPPDSLLILGEKDKVIRQDFAVLGAAVLDIEHLTVIKNSAHGFIFTHPEETADVVSDYLDAELPTKTTEDPSNNWVRFYANTPRFWGSLFGYWLSLPEETVELLKSYWQPAAA